MYQPIINSLPQLYQNFLPKVFFEETPKETLATCHDCIMCKEWEAKKARGEKYFTPKGKCCTYFPAIPNYLIGSLLSDTSPEMKDGVSRVKEIIKSKKGITPTYLRPPVAYHEKYKAFSKFNFGLAHDLICPLNDQSNGNCTIWKHRNAVCSQWYCKSVGAKAGKAFWDASRDYLNKVQQLLAGYSAAKLGIDLLANSKGRKQPDDRKGIIDEELYLALWGAWVGKEKEFYIQTYELINGLDHEKFEVKFSKKLNGSFEEMKKKKDAFQKVVDSTS